MKEYSINLVGRVKNFTLPKNRPLVPLFEAIVNSLHAIEERKKSDSKFDNAYINITILRSLQDAFDEVNELQNIEGFTIVDNGCGFNKCNMSSFLESDSSYKAEIGGKGVGRFSWLKTFESVYVSSVYKEKEENAFFKREFEFSLKSNSIDDTLAKHLLETDFMTTIRLESYLKEYDQEVPKDAEIVAKRIIEHCLVYFLSGNCPEINLNDNENSINLNDLFRQKFKTEKNLDRFKINDINFNLLNVKIEEKLFGKNKLYLCANNRLVKSQDLEKHIVDLDKQIFERNGFWYIGVITSDYLDKNVDMNRLSFSIPENRTTLIKNISLDQIISTASSEIENYLKVYLSKIKKEKKDRITNYTSKEAPQFRHLMKYMPNEIEKIKPNLSADKLDDALYAVKRKFDKTAKKENLTFLKRLKDNTITKEEYHSSFEKQIKKISDSNSAALAEYVAHRKVIIDLFECGLYKKEDGKFNKEKYMHDLMYPMRTTSDEIEYESHNLWLIDEKLSYCCYITSDVPFNNDPKEERTDILILDHPVAIAENKNDGTEFDTIILFELKRPMRDDYTLEDNPIAQLTNYVIKIQDGKAKDKNGRIIRVSSSTKFYLYAVSDVTEKLKNILVKHHSFSQTPDKIGYYNYNKSLNAYFEVLSYDKILNDAKKRNRVLFEKLGL